MLGPWPPILIDSTLLQPQLYFFCNEDVNKKQGIHSIKHRTTGHAFSHGALIKDANRTLRVLSENSKVKRVHIILSLAAAIICKNK
jgi:hypothetical protein